MNLDLADSQLAEQLKHKSGLFVTEAYKLPDGRFVFLYTESINEMHKKGYIAISKDSNLEQEFAGTWEYPSLAAASYALVNWEPTVTPAPRGFNTKLNPAKGKNLHGTPEDPRVTS